MLSNYSLGIGDRFGHEGKAQLSAIIKAKKELDLTITPVWNKSNREHQIINTHPRDVKSEAESAVKSLGWRESYFIDADHINLKNVNKFIPFSNYFTIDVAEYVNRVENLDYLKGFLDYISPFTGNVSFPGSNKKYKIYSPEVQKITQKYISPIQEANKIYNYIKHEKNEGKFITEISMDEMNQPQSPIELFIILALIAYEEIPINTIAPKFIGNFYKGIDYIGDLKVFEKEFKEYLAVLTFVKEEFQFTQGIKISIHSGSDKFSLYEIMKDLMKKFNTGVHLKTAGTTWLEEMLGLAEASQMGLNFVKEIYNEAFLRLDELIKPYRLVVRINKDKLPNPEIFQQWTQSKVVKSFTHEPQNPDFNQNIRQLLHISYKIASEKKDKFSYLLQEYRKKIESNVAENLYKRHIMKLFPFT